MREPRLPPGSRLPRLLQTAMWAVYPNALSRYCVSRYGEVFTLRPIGIGDVVVLTRPEAIREVFTGDREIFRAGEANSVMGPMLGKHSLLLLDGEDHLRHRRMLSPPFHGEAVRAYGERIAAIAAEEVERWPVGVEFPIRPRMQAITLEVILQTVIGVSEERRLERLRGLLRRITRVGIVEMWLTWTYPGLVERPLLRRLSTLRVLPEVDRLLYEEIAAHRADPEGREDVLALLLAETGTRAEGACHPASAARDEQGRGLSDEELRDHLITLLVAGHETTTTALAWCFERLLRHPAALERLEREIEGGEEHAYMEAVINETLRVRPVIDAVWRKLSAPAEVAGHLLPAGATVMPSIVLVQGGGGVRGCQGVPPGALPGGRKRSAIHVHPLRRRSAPLHRGELRDDGDEGDPPRGARTGAAARPECEGRASEGAPHHAGPREGRTGDRHGQALGATRRGRWGASSRARIRQLKIGSPPWTSRASATRLRIAC